MEEENNKSDKTKRRYIVTGAVARERVAPLLPTDWLDLSTVSSSTSTTSMVANNNTPKHTSECSNSHPAAVIIPDFLWENSPRRATKEYRDKVKVYSHLPNGTNILDNKWVLGRLFGRSQDSNIGALETHCFRGLDGFERFAKRVGLLLPSSQEIAVEKNVTSTVNDHRDEESISHTKHIDLMAFPDIMRNDMDLNSAPSIPCPENLWVVKDAAANGAGGIWVVGPQNAASFLGTTPTSGMSPPTSTPSDSKSPLYPDHKYVAQKYAWPPVLFDGRKCHVRVYGLLTSDGRGWVHHRAFLHVANDLFTIHTPSTKSVASTNDSKPDKHHSTQSSTSTMFEDSIHITNCCANSHDPSKFAGEILADLEATETSSNKYTSPKNGAVVEVPTVPLATFFPAISKCMAHLAKTSSPFLQGGQANHGFEYMGVDFMLSYDTKTKKPVAYILEVNAPPSQDSATGLPHAEDLHNQVIEDLTTLWVLPHVLHNTPPKEGGWRCIFEPEVPVNQEAKIDLIVPSKAAIINKIRWTIFEKKAQRLQMQEEKLETVETEKNDSKQDNTEKLNGRNDNVDSRGCCQISAFARTQFPFFSDVASFPFQSSQMIFFENAGGSQVAQTVVDASIESLQFRHRERVGSTSKQLARDTLRTILGAREDHLLFLGPNATALLSTLAHKYRTHKLLQEGDEIILSIENHKANFDPWINVAKACKATIKFWSPFKNTIESSHQSSDLCKLVTPKTRLAVISHASNVLGTLRNLQTISAVIKDRSENYSDIVVDGVAAVPHTFADLSNLMDVDWYVTSCHKLYGPHVGGLCATRRAASQFVTELSASSEDDSSLYNGMEQGTMNYEGCAGVVGIGRYLAALSSFDEGINEAEGVLSPSGEVCSEGVSPCDTLLWYQRSPLTKAQVQEAYRRIRVVELSLVSTLLDGLLQSSRVRIISDHTSNTLLSLPPLPCPSVSNITEKSSTTAELALFQRLPTISFLHDTISPETIVSHCEQFNITCRCSSFLCTEYLAHALNFDITRGVVRVSLLHYNTVEEIQTFIRILRQLPDWA